MKRDRRLLRSLACCGMLLSVLALGCKQDTVTSEAAQSQPQQIGKLPVVSKTGPHPKAVLDDTKFHFGTMEHGTKGEHAFAIHNKGEAPLELFSDPSESSCQCTVGKVGETAVPPGGSTEVILAWEIKSPASKFSHHAKVRTNDPENQVIELRVEGFVGQHLAVRPGGTWSLGRVQEESAAVITGTIHSETVEQFEILKVDSDSPYVKTEWRPLTPDELDGLREPTEASAEQYEQHPDGPEAAEKARQDAIDSAAPPTYGYELTARLDGKMPLGPIRMNLAVHTDIEKVPVTNIAVTGTRVGPVEIIPLGGLPWSSKTMRARLGGFPATEGKEARLSMFVLVPEGLDFEITEVRTEPEFLEVRPERDEKFQGKDRARYILNLKIPGGLQPHARVRNSNGAGNNFANVVLKTNHPDAGEIRFDVEYVAE